MRIILEGKLYLLRYNRMYGKLDRMFGVERNEIPNDR